MTVCLQLHFDSRQFNVLQIPGNWWLLHHHCLQLPGGDLHGGRNCPRRLPGHLGEPSGGVSACYKGCWLEGDPGASNRGGTFQTVWERWTASMLSSRDQQDLASSSSITRAPIQLSFLHLWMPATGSGSWMWELLAEAVMGASLLHLRLDRLCGKAHWISQRMLLSQVQTTWAPCLTFLWQMRLFLSSE